MFFSRRHFLKLSVASAAFSATPELARAEMRSHARMSEKAVQRYLSLVPKGHSAIGVDLQKLSSIANVSRRKLEIKVSQIDGRQFAVIHGLTPAQVKYASIDIGEIRGGQASIDSQLNRRAERGMGRALVNWGIGFVVGSLAAALATSATAITWPVALVGVITAFGFSNGDIRGTLEALTEGLGQSLGLGSACRPGEPCELVRGGPRF